MICKRCSKPTAEEWHIRCASCVEEDKHDVTCKRCGGIIEDTCGCVEV